MTRRAIYAKLLAAKPDHADQSRIGSRVIYAKPDGRERINDVYRVIEKRAERKTA